MCVPVLCVNRPNIYHVVFDLNSFIEDFLFLFLHFVDLKYILSSSSQTLDPEACTLSLGSENYVLNGRFSSDGEILTIKKLILYYFTTSRHLTYNFNYIYIRLM